MSTEHDNCLTVRDYIGKTIASVAEENDGLKGEWYSPQGVTITFTDGSVLVFTADMGQGAGYLIVDEETTDE